MAKDPTQGPLSTYDEFGKPIKADVDMPAEDMAVEDVAAENEATEEVGEIVPNETGDDIEFRVESAPEEVSRIEQTEDSLVEGGVGEAAAEAEEVAPEIDASVEDGVIENEEEIWDRLTVTGAESDPDKGEVKHVEFTCDRCGETKEGMSSLPEWTAGFYALDDLGWAKYANEGEEILCDACMHSDERYLADYPDEPKEEESPDVPAEKTETSAEAAESEEATEEETVEEEVAEEEEFVTHEHEVKPPLTYNEAETMLMETSFVKMKEMAVADGIKPDRSRVKVMRQLLELWFPAPATPAGEEVEPEMSVRIRRAKGLM